MTKKAPTNSAGCFEHGRLFGYEAAKVGVRRRCPYLPNFTESIRGWYEGWDSYWNRQPEWKQKEKPV